MNKYFNPRLLNTVVSGPGMKHPRKPHVIIGDKLNGFVQGDLMDANAVEEFIDQKIEENDNIDQEKIEEAINKVVGLAPEALDTLQELSAALGDDANFASTVTDALANKVDKVEGKGLSTNDYTDEDQQKLNTVISGLSTETAARISADNALSDVIASDVKSVRSEIQNNEQVIANAINKLHCIVYYPSANINTLAVENGNYYKVQGSVEGEYKIVLPEIKSAINNSFSQKFTEQKVINPIYIDIQLGAFPGITITDSLESNVSVEKITKVDGFELEPYNRYEIKCVYDGQEWILYTKCIYREQIIMTKESNPEVLKVLHNVGIAAREDRLTITEVANTDSKKTGSNFSGRFGGIFAGNTEITHFDELYYFSQFTGIDGGAFDGCSNLRTIALPPQCVSLYPNCFRNCTSLEYIKHINNIKEFWYRCLYGCSNFAAADYLLPEGVTKVESMTINGTKEAKTLGNIPASLMQLWNYSYNGTSLQFGGDGTEGSYAALPEGWKELAGNCFRGAMFETFVLPASLETLQQYALYDQSYGGPDKIPYSYIIFKGTTPPSGQNIQVKQNAVDVYVPDESVQLYKDASNFQNLANADKIHPMSELPERLRYLVPEFFNTNEEG